MQRKYLLLQKSYTASGIHLGSREVTQQMKQFVYKRRPDGLSLLDLKKIDQRIRIASRFLANKQKILVVSRKQVGFAAVKKFGEVVGAKVQVGRYLPGTLTNPSLPNFFEADVLLVTDPEADWNAVQDASKARIPVVALCHTSNQTQLVDFVLPVNNKTKKSIATVYYLLAREILKQQGKIKENKEFPFTLEEFQREV